MVVIALVVDAKVVVAWVDVEGPGTSTSPLAKEDPLMGSSLTPRRGASESGPEDKPISKQGPSYGCFHFQPIQFGPL